MRSDAAVFTIGHSNHGIAEFVNLLQRHNVTAIADVRSVPYSRLQPQFNREVLSRTLKEQGIAYVFLGKELGGRSEDENCYENGRIHYRRVARTHQFQIGLARVRAGSGKHRVAVMCAEREPLECHRTLLVSRELVATGTPVVHIHGDGHLESHPDAMMRLLKVVGLPEQDLFLSQTELIEAACAKQEQRIAYVEQEPAAENEHTS